MKTRSIYRRISSCFAGFTVLAAGALGSHAQQLQQPRWDNDPPPVGDQVPCLLTNKQNYSARGLIAPAPPSSAEMLANALEMKATTYSATQDNSSKTDDTSKIKAQALTNAAQTLRERYSTSSYAVLKKSLPAIQNQAVNDAVNNTVKGLSAGQKSSAASAANTEMQQTIESAAAQLSSTFQRPKDVSCSMSVLSWDETHKSLGRTIADTYLVVQVTVRNLDNNNEFLVQDAELAVDANSAQLSRFQVSHEKELARGVLQYGQSYDRQHVLLSIVDGIGTILGAVVTIPQPAIDVLTGATGAYHAGLMPALHTLFPDLTTKNLNTLNDLAFSAASASRIVVPKSGSVPFIIFVPIKPLEQACWLQPGYNFYKDNPLSSACDQVCKDGACSTENLAQVRFKHWTPIQLQALEAHAYALIAGTHIKAAGQPAVLNGFTCAAPTDPSGAYLQYALPASGLTCTLSGTDLDMMTILRLRPPDNPTTNIDAKVTVSGDNTTATATIASADSAKIQNTSYELFSVDKSATENDLSRTINFRLPPSITAGQNLPAPSATATLNGSNLAGVAQIVFFDAATDTNNLGSANVTGAVQGSITFTVPAAAALPTGVPYTVRLVLADGANTLFDTHTTVTH